MPSYRPYMSMKTVDLRHELASRNLPTEGLKQDLAFRLASLDDADNLRPSKLPLSTGSSSETGNEESASVKTKEYHVSTSEARKRSPKQSPPSKIDSTSSSVHDHDESDKEPRRIGRRTRLSIALYVAFLSVLLISFLACILWRYIPGVGQGYLSRSLRNGNDFVLAIFNDCQDFVVAMFNDCQDFMVAIFYIWQDFVRFRLQGYYNTIYMGIQRLSVALTKLVSNSHRPPPTFWWNGQ